MSKCCNDNCRQGRDCPNKPTYNLRWIGDVVFFALLAILVAIGYFSFMEWGPSRGGYKVYDCSISEISPDFPLEAKEACRKLRAKHD